MLAAGSALAQTQAIQSNFSSSGTTSGASSNTTHRLYSVSGQPVASGSNIVTQPQSGFLQTTHYIMVIIDNAPPVIIYATPTKGLIKGSPNTLSVQIIDNNNSITSAKMFYRPVGGLAFTSADLTKGLGNNYDINIAQAWYDAMGLEYYFTAADAAPIPNTARSPAMGSHYAYLTDPEVNVPITSFGANQNNYRIVAFPYTIGNNAVATLFEELGEYNIARWRMATYNNITDEFLEYPGVVTNLQRGKGYWLIIKNTTTLSVGPAESPQENRANLYKMTLHPGWNMIGNPYPVDIAWGDVRELNNNPAIGPLQVFTGGWETGEVLPPFQGGFVNYSGTTSETINIPFKGQTTEGGRKAHSDFSSDIASDKWKVNLHIIQNELYNKLGGFGMHTRANDGIDYYDNLNPPRFLDAPEVTFLTQATASNVCADIVEPKDNHIWKFMATGNPGSKTALSWGNDLGDNNKELYLWDERNLVAVNMKESQGYNFTQAGKEHEFKIFFGENIRRAMISDVIVFSAPYPNPLEKDRVLKFRVMLPQSNEAYNLNFDLVSATGARVFEETKTLPSGIHELSFTIPEETQESLYFYRLWINGMRSPYNTHGKIVIR